MGQVLGMEVCWSKRAKKSIGNIPDLVWNEQLRLPSRVISRIMRRFFSIYFPMSKEEPVDFVCYRNIVLPNGVSSNFRCHCGFLSDFARRGSRCCRDQGKRRGSREREKCRRVGKRVK